MKAKALLSVVGAFAFFMLWGQEEPLTKVNDKTRVPQRTFTHEAVQDPVPIAEFGEGGSGYKQYFYYGDPCCMYLEKSFENGRAELADGSILEGLFRYNIYHQKMQAVMEATLSPLQSPARSPVFLSGIRSSSTPPTSGKTGRWPTAGLKSSVKGIVTCS